MTCRWRRRFIAYVVLAIPAVASSQSIDDLTIEWRSPDGCSSPAELDAALKNMIGTEWQGEVPHRFEGSAVKHDGKWAASLAVITGDETYTRSVEVNTCEAATQVVALLIALALDPALVLSSENPDLQSSLETLEEASQAESDPDEPEPEPPPPPPDVPETESPEETPAPPVAEADAKPRNLWFSAGLSFVADVGTASTFGPGLSLDGAFRAGKFRLELSARYLPPRDIDITGVDNGVYRPQLFGGSLGAGLQLTVRRFHVAPLLGLAFHGIFAEAQGIEQPARGQAWFLSAWLGVTVAWLATEGFGLMLQPALHFLFSRPGFDIEGVGLVYRPERVAGIFKIGVFFQF